jgi:ADP-ribose pyrophosphatase YjhB (NUDIX family)
MAGRRLVYAESDGQVYLVQDASGVWTFPDEGSKLPFVFEERHRTTILGDEVAFVRPELDHHPEHWVFKDAVPTMESVDPVVRRAVNASLARCVVGVVVVKSSRGFTKGMWNIPGGFIEYGEHPEEAAVREIKEETGLEISLGRLLGVYMERFESPYFMYGFMYEATADSKEVVLDPTEIEASAWMTADEAIRCTRNPFAVAAFRRAFES